MAAWGLVSTFFLLDNILKVSLVTSEASLWWGFFSVLLKIKELATTIFSSNKIYSAMRIPFSNSVQNIESNATNWCQNFTSYHLLVNKPIQTAGDSLKINNSLFSSLNNSLHLHCRHQTVLMFSWNVKRWNK